MTFEPSRLAPVHPNIARARKAYEAYGRGDFKALVEVYADDLLWHVGGKTPLAGDYKGREAIFGFFGRIFEMSGGTVHIEVKDILANDNHVVVLVHTTAQRGERRLAQNGVHVFRVEDGLAKEFWGFIEDQDLDDEFWS